MSTGSGSVTWLDRMMLVEVRVMRSNEGSDTAVNAKKPCYRYLPRLSVFGNHKVILSKFAVGSDNAQLSGHWRKPVSNY